MVHKAVIFDLDLTLIASEAAEPFRRPGKWNQAYALVPQLSPYEGIHEIIAALRKRGNKVAIVTSSPRPYCSRILEHWGWQFDTTVCYHDTSRRKPHPDPILKALDDLNVAPSDALSVGDAPGDVKSAKAAQVAAGAALWGSVDPAALLAEDPQFVFHTVAELTAHLRL